LKRSSDQVIEYVIGPPPRFAVIDWRELWRFRSLFVAFAWRDVVVRYKQTVLGFAWAILRPLLSVVVFTLVFNRLVHVPGDPSTPYPIFVLTGLLFWQYYADVVLNASLSMVQNAPLLQKVYFPRLIVPLASAMTALVDAAVCAAMLIVMMIAYGYSPRGVGVILLPILAVETVLAALGLGLFAAAINTRYRDVRHALPFGLEILKYVTPVFYSASLLDGHQRLKAAVLWVNPVAGIIDVARQAMFGTTSVNWIGIGIAAFASSAMFLIGLMYFRRTERFIADLI